MSNESTVGIVGAGPFGTALAHVVSGAGRSVVILSQTEEVVAEINDKHTNHDRLPGVELDGLVRATSDMAELASAARFLVVALRSEDVRERARELGSHLDGSHLVVHAIGAYAMPGAIPVSDVLVNELPTLRVGALAGPALVRDLVAGRVCSMVCASKFNEVVERARTLLSCPPVLRVYGSRDVAGVELASALSGVYTIALGLADGLEVGAGTRAVLITRLVAEASRLGSAQGADPWTFAGLAGLGNLLVRGSGGESSSPEYEYGAQLARGERTTERAPVAASTAHALAHLAEHHGRRMPVLGALHQVLVGEIDPRLVAQQIADTVAKQE